MNSKQQQAQLAELRERFPKVPANAWHRHPNGGGWVQDTAYVEESAYIGPEAVVCGQARVSGKAQVTGNAQVGGYAEVTGNARLEGGRLADGVLITLHGERTVNPASPGRLRIGSAIRTYEEWLESGQIIAEAHGFGNWFSTLLPILPWLIEQCKSAFVEEKSGA